VFCRPFIRTSFLMRAVHLANSASRLTALEIGTS
jgi:hypothetical protein